MLPGARRESDPASGQHAQHMTVREQRHIAADGAGASDHAIDPCAHLLRRLAAWSAVTEDLPAGRACMDRVRGDAFVFSRNSIP